MSHDDAGEDGVKKAWDQTFVDNDNLLLGLHTKTPVELSALHPRPVKIFRLWQIYLNNVDPLLKVTHAPSLQGRVIEAAEDVTKLSPTLEALLFGIYSVSITSLSAEECQNTFGSSKKDLLESYQFGCQQALPNSNYLRTADRECLTAFYLYLVWPLCFLRMDNMLTENEIVGFTWTQHRSSIPIILTWCRDAHCFPHGYPQRISLPKIPHFRS